MIQISWYLLYRVTGALPYLKWRSSISILYEHMFIIIVTKTEYKEINVHLYLITKHSYNIFIIMIVKIWYRKKSNITCIIKFDIYIFFVQINRIKIYRHHMVYVNRNRFISIFLTRFYVIAILSVIPYIMGVMHFIQLNNTYILHFTVVPNVCSLWFVIIVFEYYFNICLTFQIFKTIVLLRKERLSISFSLTGLESLW